MKLEHAELVPLAQPCHPRRCPSPPHELGPRPPPRQSFWGPRLLIRDVLKLAFGEITREDRKMPTRGRWCLVKRLSRREKKKEEKNNFMHMEAEKTNCLDRTVTLNRD